jgi:hypothetical protein
MEHRINVSWSLGFDRGNGARAGFGVGGDRGDAGGDRGNVARAGSWGVSHRVNAARTR